jgi:hypothetical protein
MTRTLPSMKTTNLHIPAVKQLLALDTSQAVQFHSTYLSSGLDPAANAGQVFASCRARRCSPLARASPGPW